MVRAMWGLTLQQFALTLVIAAAMGGIVHQLMRKQAISNAEHAEAPTTTALYEPTKSEPRRAYMPSPLPFGVELPADDPVSPAPVVNEAEPQDHAREYYDETAYMRLANAVTDVLEDLEIDGEVMDADCTRYPCIVFAQLPQQTFHERGETMESLIAALEDYGFPDKMLGAITFSWRTSAIVRDDRPGQPYALWAIQLEAFNVDREPGDTRRQEYFEQAQDFVLQPTE